MVTKGHVSREIGTRLFCKAELPIGALLKVMLQPTPQVFHGVELWTELGEEMKDIASIAALLNSLTMGNRMNKDM